MGYRSQYMSEDIGLELPEWFVDKYKDELNFWTHVDSGRPTLPISSKIERKFYDLASDKLFVDIARVLQETNSIWGGHVNVNGVSLHEDGQLSKVVIAPTSVVVTHWDDWNGNFPDEDSQYCNVERIVDDLIVREATT
ncbi:hypothetical protein G3I13_01895 [Streptomyces sp. SID6673]|nr:hypothetical protein [Streptomyces sp. SID11726]NDZ94913.1 hypothetical protein [Streptomyces sp. SID11726]NEB23073.1 hypothetical protein [Streptomyces sp. SID6673]